MDRHLRKLIDKHVPTPNPAILRGVSSLYIKEVEAYLEAVVLDVSRSFPTGLKFVNLRKCSPQETYIFETTGRQTPKKSNQGGTRRSRSGQTRRAFDIAPSDICLYALHFRYHDVDLEPRYIYLPYDFMLQLGGTLYHISPVLEDKNISVIGHGATATVFVRLLKVKINFFRLQHEVAANGIWQTGNVAWAQIFKRTKEKDRVPETTKAKTTNIHYMLARHGFSGMCQKLLGFVPEYGTDKEITLERYPQKDWTIISSIYERSGRGPKTCKDLYYEGTGIRFAVPNSQWNDQAMTVLTGVFYVIDHFPHSIFVAHLNHVETWMVLLGHIIWSAHYGEGHLHSQIVIHFNAMEYYLDRITLFKLEQCGYHFNDFFDILGVVAMNFNSWAATSNDKLPSLFDKNLEVLYYVMYNISERIVFMSFELDKKAKKPKPLTEKDIVSVMRRFIKPKTIYRLCDQHVSVAPVSSTPDLLYPKITSILAQQQPTTGGKRGRKSRVVLNEEKRINTSHALAGSLFFISKKFPNPAGRINIFATIDHKKGCLIEDVKFTKIRETTDLMLRYREPYRLIEEELDEDLTNQGEDL